MEPLEAVPVTDPPVLRDEGLCKGQCDGWIQRGAGQNGGTRSSDLHVLSKCAFTHPRESPKRC